MIEILQNKFSATRFEILVEIAASGPNVQQRHIASRLGITPQAISEYIQKMIEEGLVISMGRSSYRVSVKGINWMLEMLRELRGYVSHVADVVRDITTCAAIAESDLKSGQKVGLKMKDGLLYATRDAGKSASGISVSDVKKGEDADITCIKGLIDFHRGKVIVLQVPTIDKGGSRQVNPVLIRSKISKNNAILGAIGIEAMVALRRSGYEPHYLYGVAEAAVEAAQCGLTATVACTADALPAFLTKLQAENVEYELVNMALKA